MEGCLRLGARGQCTPHLSPGLRSGLSPQWSAHGLWGQDLGRALMPRGYPEGSDRMPAGW